MISNEELLAFVKRHPVCVASAALAVVFGAITFYRSSSEPELLAALDEKSREGRRLAANLRNGAQLSEQLAQLTTATAAIETRLVRASELANNLQFFYRLEAETGVKLLDVRQNSPSAAARNAATAGGLGGVPFSVSVEGEYRAVLEFLRRLDHGVHYCRIMSGNVSGSGADRSGPVKLSVELELLGQL